MLSNGAPKKKLTERQVLGPTQTSWIKLWGGAQSFGFSQSLQGVVNMPGTDWIHGLSASVPSSFAGVGLDPGKAQASCGPQFPHLFMDVGIQLHVPRVTARGELGPQDSWSPPQMECQMRRDGSCLDCHPVLTRNLFLLVHSLRISENLAHHRSIP